MKINLQKRVKTPEDKTVYSLKPNDYIIDQYSNNLIDISIGFPFGFSILSRKKNNETQRACIGFEKILENDFNYLNTNVLNVFLSNLMDVYPKFDKYHLIHAKNKLTNFIKHGENGKEKFIAIFCWLYDSEQITYVSHKIPFLFSNYFGDSIFTEKTIKQWLTVPKKRSQTLEKEINNVAKWIHNMDKSNQ